MHWLLILSVNGKFRYIVYIIDKLT